MSGVHILPVVTLVDIAGTGAVLCSVIPATSSALPRTVLACYAIWGFSLPLANLMLVLYFHRLAIHKVPMAHLEANSDDKWPPKQEIAGLFLLIGPLGRGSFAIIDLGTMAQKVF